VAARWSKEEGLRRFVWRERSDYNGNMGFESPEQPSFDFEQSTRPSHKEGEKREGKKRGGKKKKKRNIKKELSPEQKARLEELIERELAHIDDPDNMRDNILRMSSYEDKRKIASLRIWSEFIGEPPANNDPFLR
jgi:hypothetical protein